MAMVDLPRYKVACEWDAAVLLLHEGDPAPLLALIDEAGLFSDLRQLIDLSPIDEILRGVANANWWHAFATRCIIDIDMRRA